MDYLLHRLPPPRSAGFRWAATVRLVALSMSLLLLIRDTTGVLGWFLLLPSGYLEPCPSVLVQDDCRDLKCDRPLRRTTADWKFLVVPFVLFVTIGLVIA